MRNSGWRATIGLVGCGNVSSSYLRGLTLAPDLIVTGCADLDREAARRLATRFGIPFCAPDELIEDSGVEIVLNLTTPAAHASVSKDALNAGKHVYTEKPLAASFAAGRQLLDLAEAKGLRIGAAPDTFLGSGWQTARRLIDEGAIGTPLSADAAFLFRGHEEWHPRPAFYYQPGGGPLMDMGPYYLTGLVSILGPIERVTGITARGFDQREIKTGPAAGDSISVEVPTHVVALLEFASGPLACLTTSFDTWSPKSSRVSIYGSEATLQLPDPNSFAGVLRIWRRDRGWQRLPLDPPADPLQARGIGLAEMVRAIAVGRQHRANGGLALHVLEAMEAIEVAGRTGERQVLTTSVTRPQPFIPSTL